MINGPDAEKADRVRAAMYTMKKLDITELERAYAAGAQHRASAPSPVLRQRRHLQAGAGR